MKTNEKMSNSLLIKLELLGAKVVEVAFISLAAFSIVFALYTAITV